MYFHVLLSSIIASNFLYRINIQVYFKVTLYTADPQCVEGDVRLFSNQSNEEFVMGQVEICSAPRLGGFRTKVCDTNWDDQDAEVVCRELGLPHGRYTNLTVSIGSQP